MARRRGVYLFGEEGASSSWAYMGLGSNGPKSWVLANGLGFKWDGLRFEHFGLGPKASDLSNSLWRSFWVLLHSELAFSHHRAFVAGLKPRVSTIFPLDFLKNCIHAFKFFKKSTCNETNTNKHRNKQLTWFSTSTGESTCSATMILGFFWPDTFAWRF